MGRYKIIGGRVIERKAIREMKRYGRNAHIRAIERNGFEFIQHDKWPGPHKNRGRW